MANSPSSDNTAPPPTAPAIAEELLEGSRALLGAFLRAALHQVEAGAPIIRLGERDAPLALIRRGFVCRCHVLTSGSRAIVDILVPGDIAGLDQILTARPIGEFTSAGPVTYGALGVEAVRNLMKDDPNVSLRLLAMLAETRWRIERLATMVMRLDARQRIAGLILELYQRLRRRGLISRMTFNLPLTQEQIGDCLGLSLVHVNRTLRQLNDDRLLIVQRQVVIIRDFERLRELLHGLPEPAYVPSQMMPDLAASRGGSRQSG